jgi:hypothetical protein
LVIESQTKATQKAGPVSGFRFFYKESSKKTSDPIYYLIDNHCFNLFFKKNSNVQMP